MMLRGRDARRWNIDTGNSDRGSCYKVPICTSCARLYLRYVFSFPRLRCPCGEDVPVIHLVVQSGGVPDAMRNGWSEDSYILETLLLGA